MIGASDVHSLASLFTIAISKLVREDECGNLCWGATCPETDLLEALSHSIELICHDDVQGLIHELSAQPTKSGAVGDDEVIHILYNCLPASSVDLLVPPFGLLPLVYGQLGVPRQCWAGLMHLPMMDMDHSNNRKVAAASSCDPADPADGAGLQHLIEAHVSLIRQSMTTSVCHPTSLTMMKGFTAQTMQQEALAVLAVHQTVQQEACLAVLETLVQQAQEEASSVQQCHTVNHHHHQDSLDPVLADPASSTLAGSLHEGSASAIDINANKLSSHLKQTEPCPKCLMAASMLVEACMSLHNNVPPPLGAAGSSSACSTAVVERYDARARNAVYLVCDWLGVEEQHVMKFERMHATQCLPSRLLINHGGPGGSWSWDKVIEGSLGASKWVHDEDYESADEGGGEPPSNHKDAATMHKIISQGNGSSSRSSSSSGFTFKKSSEGKQAAQGAKVSAQASSGSSKTVRALKIGGAALGAGALLAITGGLAAPAIAAGLGAMVTVAGGGAAAGAAVAGAAGSASGALVISGAFGAAGAATAGSRVHGMVASIKEFSYIQLTPQLCDALSQNCSQQQQEQQQQDSPSTPQNYPQRQQEDILSMETGNSMKQAEGATASTAVVETSTEIRSCSSAKLDNASSSCSVSTAGSLSDTCVLPVKQVEPASSSSSAPSPAVHHQQGNYCKADNDKEAGAEVKVLKDNMEDDGKLARTQIPGLTCSTTCSTGTVVAEAAEAAAAVSPLLCPQHVPFSRGRAEDGAACCTIAVNGWLSEEGGMEDFVLPWVGLPSMMSCSTVPQQGQYLKGGFNNRYALVWEDEMLRGLGTTLSAMIKNQLLQASGTQILKAMALGGMVAALALPLAALTALNMIMGDRWTRALHRSKAAGVLLAHQLASGCAGSRPVTLLGFSIGARLIFHCLLELERLGRRGIVQSVVLMGSPISVDKLRWNKAKSVVSGRFINVYSAEDWVLGLLYRSHSATAMLSSVAGLSPVQNIIGVQNVGVTRIVKGHSDYVTCMSEVLEAVDLKPPFG
ncbi:hypothetical protein CEUSTIGMA_g1876.t1 [Chlamydomonas eustigma]|uniref:DUF726 domain-containing protein n=1 Tax=Chlamydomonas eustigma TaxID=1157962 RepID=A0A250WUC4_9CHLO|nr:hypothetical protein CEUSTIGMA_g1876.t1 [Chlamydomonas eustigma]|eukprot:GAX74427.1 hypothetical protein CEUSTIGMA_g1876.t1 [Chlamydomonas eustigma]